MNLTAGELTILVTTVIGFGGSLVAQWAAHAKANRAAEDIISNREQDRLDLEQKAKEALDLQKMELQFLQAKAEAAAASLRATATRQHAEVLGVMVKHGVEIAKNTVLTEQGVKRAEEAYHEANTVNLKLEKIGIDNLKEQLKKADQQSHIEENVVATHEKVDEVISILAEEKSGNEKSS